MGIITQSLQDLESKYISGEYAIKYLAWIENNNPCRYITYSDVASFLLLMEMDRFSFLRCYTKERDGFYEIPPRNDAYPGGITYSSEFADIYYDTQNFLQHVADYGVFERGSLIPEYPERINFYWKKSEFLIAIKNIFSESQHISIDEVDLPDIDNVVEKIKEQETGQAPTQNVDDSVTHTTTEQPTAAFNEQPTALKAANKAFNKFWGNAHPAEPDTHPINKTVIAWLKEQDISPTKARQIAEIIRPDWAAKGRRSDK